MDRTDGTAYAGTKKEQESGKGRPKKPLLIIPAYNEAENIERVVEELSAYPQVDYVVVTDGSTDGTDRICRERGFSCICLPVNLGLTGCFQTGMKYALRRGYTAAVQLDGDGQHRPEDVGPMLEKLREGGYDMVLGSRFLEGDSSMHPLRNIGSKLIRGAILLTTGNHVTDPTCGLRVYSERMIRLFAGSHGYAPEPDTLSWLLKNGARVAEVPVVVREREGGTSYLKPAKAAWYMLRMLCSILIIQNFRNHNE